MDIHELNFISFLFNDGYIMTTFKGNTVSFIDDESGEKFSIIYPGNMKTFLKELAALNISDDTSLCNIPTAAKAALYYIK